MTDLRAFVAESNRIEGIHREPLDREIKAHERLLALPVLDVPALEAFVEAIQPGARLREHPGMDVRVGNHRPPRGDPLLRTTLIFLLEDAVSGLGAYETHQRYESLHPFMDGNGRSGRAVWLWQMLREGRDRHVLSRGFLHTLYYQSLAAYRP